MKMRKCIAVRLSLLMIAGSLGASAAFACRGVGDAIRTFPAAHGVFAAALREFMEQTGETLGDEIARFCGR